MSQNALYMNLVAILAADSFHLQMSDMSLAQFGLHEDVALVPCLPAPERLLPCTSLALHWSESSGA